MSQFEIPFPVASLALFSGPCDSSGVEGTVVPLIPGCAKRDPIRTNLRGLGWSTGGKSLTLCWLPRHHLEHTTFPPVDSHPLHGVVARPRGTRRPGDCQEIARRSPGDRQEIAITGSCGNARSRPRRCGRWSSSATGPSPPPAPPRPKPPQTVPRRPRPATRRPRRGDRFDQPTRRRLRRRDPRHAVARPQADRPALHPTEVASPLGPASSRRPGPATRRTVHAVDRRHPATASDPHHPAAFRPRRPSDPRPAPAGRRRVAGAGRVGSGVAGTRGPDRQVPTDPPPPAPRHQPHTTKTSKNSLS